jgi:hypothetical protein
MTASSDQFPTDAAGLPHAARPQLVELSHGDDFALRIAPVAKRLGQANVRMLAYNGSIPGPTLKVLAREPPEVSPGQALSCCRVNVSERPGLDGAAGRG